MTRLYNFIGLSLLVLFSCKTNVNTSASRTASKTDSTSGSQKPKKSARPVHWTYTSEEGPSAWGKLSPVYALCSSGKQQSPINISQTEVKNGVSWKISYKKTSLKIAQNEHMDDILDNGHTIQITVDEGSTFELNHKTYHLKQFHFHTPSEHTINEKSFPMEVHFVHQNDSGDLAVVAVLVVEGKENPNFAKIIANLPTKKGETKHLTKVHLALQFHLPKTVEAYHYQGSLTTPPCSENVEWLVFKHYVTASKKQIQAIAAKIGNNNRPIQELNERSIKLDALKGKVQN